MTTVSVEIGIPRDFSHPNRSDAVEEQRYAKFEHVILNMQQPDTGIDVRDYKTLIKTVPSCFVANELLDWLQDHMNFDRNEASVFAHRLFKEGYIFPVEEFAPIIDSAEQYLRFQTPYFWPSVSGVPTEFDYAVYLVKCNKKKGAKGMKPHELEDFARLQHKLRRSWGFVLQHATNQINELKDHSAVQVQIFDTQERALWWVHRPTKKQEEQIMKAMSLKQKLCTHIDPKVLKAPGWGVGLAELLEDPDGYASFRAHIEHEHNQENLNFWEICVSLERSSQESHLIDMDIEKEVRAIYYQFLVENAPDEVNIPASVRDQISKRIQAKDIDAHIFADAQLAIQNLIAKDIYIRYLRSPEYLEMCVLAEKASWLSL